MCAVAFGQQYLGRLLVKLIFELYERAAKKFDSSAYENLVIVARGGLKAATDLRHSDVAVIFLLHEAIFKAKLAQQFYAADFKPDNVIGVVNDAHLVGFRIAHAETSFADVIGIFH